MTSNADLPGNTCPTCKGTGQVMHVIERDEYGIPLGEHTLTCGCKMVGRSLMEACGDHHRLFHPLHPYFR